MSNHAQGSGQHLRSTMWNGAAVRQSGRKVRIRTWPTFEWSWASDTFANASTKLPTNGEENALARIRNDSAGVRVSAHVPDANGNKQNALVRRGTRRDMVAPVWGAVSLIPDEITLAGKGQIQLTAVMLHAVKILRTGGFYKQETNHS